MTNGAVRSCNVFIPELFSLGDGTPGMQLAPGF